LAALIVDELACSSQDLLQIGLVAFAAQDISKRVQRSERGSAKEDVILVLVLVPGLAVTGFDADFFAAEEARVFDLHDRVLVELDVAVDFQACQYRAFVVPVVDGHAVDLAALGSEYEDGLTDPQAACVFKAYGEDLFGCERDSIQFLRRPEQ
jgi:hypothetical protein